MNDHVSLDKKRMHVVSTANGGVVGSDTLFTFEQDGQTVSARYTGGGVLLGFLIGILSDGDLAFHYVQLGSDGRLDSGQSTCELLMLPDGRIRLVEHFRWHSREGTGVNIFEEL